jgi:hypothetical protein
MIADEISEQIAVEHEVSRLDRPVGRRRRLTPAGTRS